MATRGKATPPRGGEGWTLERLLEAARAGAPPPVVLLDGDAFLAGRAARDLSDRLVPEAQRALNLVELDAAASPAEVAAEIETRGLFAGPASRKVVVVREPAFLTAKEDGAEPFAAARDAWAKGRQREGARRLLALAAKAGWRAAHLVADADGRPDASDWKRELGVTADAYDDGFVAEAARYAIERELKVSKDDASPLDAALARGLPPGHVLVVAAGKVDGRLPLLKRLAAAGARVSLGIAMEGKWDDQRPVLRPVLDGLLAGTGKQLDAAAESRLAELVGADARTLASEVAKLVAHAGERQRIGAADVDLLVSRVAEDPFFALGNAVEARDLPAALGVLDRSLADGPSPFLLLATLASTVRRLVVQRERARKLVGDVTLKSSRAWEAQVLPHLPEEETKGKHPYGLWKKYEASRRYRREALLRALADLADADEQMKNGGDAPPLLERVLWRLMGNLEQTT